MKAWKKVVSMLCTLAMFISMMNLNVYADTLATGKTSNDNIALNKPVTLSSVEGGYNADGSLVNAVFDPQNATDGIIDTTTINANRTSIGQAVGEYYEIDLQDVYAVTNVAIYYYPMAPTLDIELSVDGTEWNKVLSHSFTSLNNKPGSVDLALPTQTDARYVRVVQTSLYNKKYSLGVNEIEVYAYDLSSKEPADYTEVNEAVAFAAKFENNVTDYSAIKAAVDAIDYDKKDTEQATVDAYATAIYTAIKNATIDQNAMTQALTYTDDTASMPYRLYVPENYDASKEYPVIVLLHGAGERGSDNISQLVHVFDDLFKTHKATWDSIIIAPQCPSGKRWVETDWAKGDYDSSLIPEQQLGTVMKILETIKTQYNTDTDRTYAMGLSMGGFGTWNLLMNHSDVFAAGVPICGGADHRKAELMADVPVWTFHGTADGSVPYAGTETMVNAIKKAGGQKITFVTYEGAGHGIWKDAAQTEGLIDWLFAQKLSDRELTNLFDRNHYDNWYKSLTYNGSKLENTKNYANIFATHQIPVVKGDTLDWSSFGEENYVMEVYSADHQLVKQVLFEEVSATALGYQVAGVKNNMKDAYRYTYTIVDDNAAYVRMLGNISTIDQFEVFKNLAVDGYAFPEAYIPYEENVLIGKSVLFVGDSITDAVKDDYKEEGWAGRIGTQNKMEWTNAGVSGASASTARPTNRIITQLQNNSSKEFDYVILHGGVNDAMEAFPIGEVSDSFAASSFVISTFAGGLEEMIHYTVSNYAGAKIGYIVNYATPNSTWGGETKDMSAYFEMAKQVCAKWNIPYIDLYSGTIELNGVEKTYSYDILDMTNKGSLYNSDAGEVHIGGHGYDLISPYIGYWMRSLEANTVGLVEKENIALNKPVYINAIEGGYKSDGTLYYDFFDPAVVTDGIIDTSKINANRTSIAKEIGNYLQIDLQETYNVNEVKVYYYPMNGAFDIYTSLDGEEFVKSASYAFAGENKLPGDVSVMLDQPTAARYVRIVQTKLSNNSEMTLGVNEVEVYAQQINTDALKAMIDTAETMTEEEIDAETLAAIEAVVKSAKLVLEFPASQEKVDAMVTKIQEVLDSVNIALAQVENLTATVDNYKTITLTWDAVKGAQGYVIERLTSNGWIDVATVNEPTYTAKGLKTGKEYLYSVRAMRVHEDGFVELGDAAHVSETPMLSGEVELTLTNNGVNKFDLTWTQVDGATRYIIYRQSGDGEWKKILTLGKDATSYTTKAMTVGTYTYQVKAARYDSTERVMTNGSNLVTGETFDDTITLTATKQDDSVTLTWNKLENMVGYEVYRATTIDGKYYLLKRTTGTQVVNTGLKANKSYFYKVRAYYIVNDEKVYTSFSEVVEVQ